MNTKKIAQLNQKGMVSITVTIVFILVISLVVLGFSQVSRRNSREALDRQLSSQAFYAAETGVNDAMDKIRKDVAIGGPVAVANQPNCTGSYTKDNGRIDSDISYTCLTVNASPPTLEYSNLGSGTSTSIPLTANIGNLAAQEVVWTPSQGAGGLTIDDCAKMTPEAKQYSAPWTNFRESSAWRCPYGALRVEITPLNSSTLNSTQGARDGSMVIFFYPVKKSAEQQDYDFPFNSVLKGKVYPAVCDANRCRVNITGMNFGKALMKVRLINADTESLRVNMSDLGDGSQRYYLGAQAVIDSTGKSRDVLRRIQARISLAGEGSRAGSSDSFDYAIRSNKSLCKRYETAPAYSGYPAILKDFADTSSFSECKN